METLKKCAYCAEMIKQEVVPLNDDDLRSPVGLNGPFSQTLPLLVFQKDVQYQ